MKDKNAINVGKLMHKYCKLKVSPAAVKELSGRILDKLYDMAPKIDEIAKSHGRKTIRDEDVIEFFSVLGNNVM